MPAPILPPLTTASSVPARVDVLIVGVTGTKDAPTVVGCPPEVEKATAKALGSSLAEAARAVGADPAVGSTAVLLGAKGRRLLLVGLGEDVPTPDVLRRASGAAVRAAGSLATADGGLQVGLALDATEPEAAQAIAEGAILGSYTYQPISSAEVAAPKVAALTLLTGGGKQVAAAATTGATVARAVARAREWVNVPPNLLYPETFADEAREWARDAKITVDVLDEKALAKGGYGGLLAVGGGSSRLPRLVRFSYAPRGAKTHIVLVGKGITFDSGGLNIKPGDSMYTMKCDMAGAAAVLAATRAVADLNLPVKVTTYAAMAENLPSDTAYRPSDVLTIYGGKTVENANSDAEGRLVLADALARSLEDKPDVIIDVATLTGACVVALGEETAGVLSNDDDLVEQVLAAADAAGELLWQLPIPATAKAKLASKVADVKSSGSRMGGALFAAAFLREFVGEHSWAHLDIAGPAFRSEGADGHQGPGGTGAAVGTLVALAQSLAK
ncbi:leucyl aminopeptidase [Propionibacteriaceae bacterium Y2011]|uniref:leucyl aminopeptidase n=1 Tax=Microlunatus sp. Y2014 TaxID=3418488 RepID=UPI003B47C3B1